LEWQNSIRVQDLTIKDDNLKNPNRVITKDNIVTAIEDAFIGFPITNSALTHDFVSYSTSPKTETNHPLFKNSINGGYERPFYDALGAKLSTQVSPTIIEFGERLVKGNKEYAFYRKVKGGRELIVRRSKRIDIIEISKKLRHAPTWNNQNVPSGAEIARNHLGQPKEYITNHFLENLYCGLQVGIENLFLLGTLDDFIPDGNNRGYFRGKKYENDRIKRVGNDDLARETIQHVRDFCRQIDTEFLHFILTTQIPNCKIYVHIFIILVPTTIPVSFDKKNLKVIL